MVSITPMISHHCFSFIPLRLEQISSSTRSTLDTILHLQSSSLGSLVASRCNEDRIDTYILDSQTSFLQAKVARLHDQFVERLHLDHIFDRSSFVLTSFTTPAHATTAISMVRVALIFRLSPFSRLFWCDVGGLFDQINSVHTQFVAHPPRKIGHSFRQKCGLFVKRNGFGYLPHFCPLYIRNTYVCIKLSCNTLRASPTCLHNQRPYG
jgi:hypothetical protein